MADDAALQAAANKFITEVWGLQGAAYLVVCLRYYSRISTLGWRKLAWDDFIMLLAVVRRRPSVKQRDPFETRTHGSDGSANLAPLSARAHGRVRHGLPSRGVLEGAGE